MLDVVLPLLAKRVPIAKCPALIPPLFAAENDHKVCVTSAHCLGLFASSCLLT